MFLYELDEMIKAVCPIHGVNSIGAIDFKESATDTEKLAAQALVDQHLDDLELPFV